MGTRLDLSLSGAWGCAHCRRKEPVVPNLEVEIGFGGLGSGGGSEGQNSSW